MVNLALFAHGIGHNSGKVIHCVRNVRADVENLIAGRGHIHGGSDNRSHIVDMGEGTLLLAVPKDGHGLAFHKLVHEDAHNIAVTIANVLPLAIYVVGAENHIVEPKHFVCDLQFVLNSHFGNPVRVFRKRDHLFRHGRLAGTVDSDGGSEDEAAHAIVDRGINKIHRANQIVVVIETLDEVTESLSGISSQVIDASEMIAVEEAIN